MSIGCYYSSSQLPPIPSFFSTRTGSVPDFTVLSRQFNKHQVSEQIKLGAEGGELADLSCWMTLLSYFFKNLHLRTCLLIFSAGGRGREREREKETNIDRPPLTHTPTKDRSPNLGMCPDQESNPQPLGLQDYAPSNWAVLARAIQLLLMGLKTVVRMKL